jgi:Holliday junction DNA helicase RuvA
MYESIRGRLLVRDPTSAVVECQGLAYRVLVPLSTYEALPAPGAEATLRLHLVVREEEWRLFGFATEEERGVFRRLIRVAGVGPVVALGLLSGLRPKELRAAVAAGDLEALTRVKGVGRKTAERVLVELREEWAAGGEVAPLAAPLADGPAADAVRALLSLGMEPGEARRRVDALLANAGGVAPDPGTLVRAALRG